MKKILLLSPLYLCSCQSAPSLPPASESAPQIVDRLINTELADIAQAQQALAQASGISFEPVIPRSPPPGTPPVARSALITHPAPAPSRAAPGLPSPSLSHTGTPQITPALVRQSGRDKPLSVALKSIVPPGWIIVRSETVRNNFRTPVSWQGNDQWPHILGKFAQNYGLKITIMWASRQVTVDYVHPVDSKATNQHMLFSSGQAGISPSAKPVSSPTTWHAQSGQTLRDVLVSWADTAPCTGLRHWTVEWVTPVNYRIDAPLTFTGSWRDALNGIFGLYQTATVPLYAGTSTPQCLLRVDTKPVR